MPECTLVRMLDDTGKFPTVAWPGCYPLYYVTEDSGTLCPDCMNAERGLIEAAEADNDSQWHVIGYDVNYENDSLYCDHCGKQIESAYGDPTAEVDETEGD